LKKPFLFRETVLGFIFGISGVFVFAQRVSNVHIVLREGLFFSPRGQKASIDAFRWIVRHSL